MSPSSSPSAAVVVVGEPSQVDPLVEVPVGEKEDEEKGTKKCLENALLEGETRLSRV